MDKKYIAIIDDLNHVQRDLNTYSYLLSTIFNNPLFCDCMSADDSLVAQYNSLDMIVELIKKRVWDNSVHLGSLTRICNGE